MSKYNLDLNNLKQKSLKEQLNNDNDKQKELVNQYLAQTTYEKERRKLEQQIKDINPIIEELNLMAAELERNVKRVKRICDPYNYMDRESAIERERK